jgi:trimethylamine-N-oxide reductase cytochrome c-type subunit TorC
MKGFLMKKTIIFIVALFGLLSYGASVYAGDLTAYSLQTIPLFLKADVKEKAIGKVFIASKFEILQNNGEWTQIKVQGWSQEGAERIIYARAGKRIFSAALSSRAVKNIKVHNTQHDPDTDLNWNAVSVEGWIKGNLYTPDLDILWKEAWTLFTTRCTACHQQRIPHKYSANQWTGLLKVMGPRTGLPKDKQRLILKFLQNHAKDTDQTTK